MGANSSGRENTNTNTNTNVTGDISDKTSVVSADTFSGKNRETPPAALVVLLGPQNYVGKQWTITKPDMVIGRQVECDIFIDDKSVSRNHSKIITRNTETLIEDLASSNKTLVNGAAIAAHKPQKLADNDQIKLGSVVFRFLAQGNLLSVAAQELADKAQKDALTGAFTKGALMERGPELMRRAEVLNEDLSIMVFDLDHFKKVNDTYGHAAGDYVLKNLSRIVAQRVVRSQDYFVRYGGEEFIIILSNSLLTQATEIGERIRQTIEQSVFEFEGKRIPVTISVGVAQKKDTETKWENIFERADAALYQSKKAGRNRVTPSL